METIQSITIPEGWAAVVAICAGIVAIAKVWEMFSKKFGKNDVKEDVKAIYVKLDADKKKITELEASNAVTMRALLALTRHSINGNNIDGLRATQDEIQNFLIGR